MHFNIVVFFCMHFNYCLLLVNCNSLGLLQTQMRKFNLLFCSSEWHAPGYWAWRNNSNKPAHLTMNTTNRRLFRNYLSVFQTLCIQNKCKYSFQARVNNTFLLYDVVEFIWYIVHALINSSFIFLRKKTKLNLFMSWSRSVLNVIMQI